jgi:hypothetical protein
LYAALLAAALAALGQLLGWHGVDTAAQVHRVDTFRAVGLSLWDSQWYGGHWTLDYSVVYPPLAAFVGLPALTILTAALAAWAFDALARRHFGSSGLLVSLVFASGTLVQASIGQLPFLLGEALGLCCLLAVRRRWRLVAAALATAATLASPLAGAFTLLAVAAWAIGSRRQSGTDRLRPALAVAAGVLAPVAVGALLFPGQGPMPYPAIDWFWEMIVAAGIFLAAGRSEPVIRAGAGLFAGAATVCLIVPTPLGGNIGRLEDIAAVPLALGLLWTRRALLMAFACVPLLLSQWSPAWGAIEPGAAAPETRDSFFQPLDNELVAVSAARGGGRIEVVPTLFHWESVYVAGVMPLARGWERQLDLADNPIFYKPGALTASNYRGWLLDNAVQYVAVPLAPLDEAGNGESRLVGSGTVPGLEVVWQSATWRLYQVAGSPPIVSGEARLASSSDASSGSLLLTSLGAGWSIVRIHYTRDWVIERGTGCISESPEGWMTVDTPGPETLELSLSLSAAGSSSCASLPAFAPYAPSGDS